MEVLMKKIRNYDELISVGCKESRKIVLDIAEQTLQRLDAYNRIKSIMHVDGNTLVIGAKSWDLAKKRNVYLLGAGKAVNQMAMAVDEILGDHLTHGIIIAKISEETDVFRNTEVFIGGHPLPKRGLSRLSENFRSGRPGWSRRSLYLRDQRRQLCSDELPCRRPYSSG